MNNVAFALASGADATLFYVMPLGEYVSINQSINQIEIKA